MTRHTKKVDLSFLRIDELGNATSKWLLTLGLVILLTGYIHDTNAAGVMSVDLGSEWMKIGVVAPGVPMEIALNKESKRKSPSIIAFRDGIRTFGEDAMATGMREPSAAFSYLMDLLGKKIDNPIVDLYRLRFPFYDIIPDPQRNTVAFRRNSSEIFTIEELVAQMLTKAKEFAEISTNQLVTECVIIVPGYFGQAEREAILTAAKLSNLKVLQLINDYAAIALNYGVFNRAEINETASYYIFYDMGAYKTSAAVVSYQLVKDKQTKEVNPAIHVLGVGYNRKLGGLEIQMRLRDYLAKEFNAMKKTKTDVTKSARALAKLFKEAGRVKNVLSANPDHYAQIENLLEDHDFKLHVTREKLEELCADIWPELIKPLEQALKASGLSINEIKQVILFGGGTRVPKVQETIRQAIKSELGKSLNADEAAAMGAVYKAADLATGFKVKKFLIRDAVIFPIHVTFERDHVDANTNKEVKRVLFGHMNTYPQKKVITFNKHTNNFNFHVLYSDLGHLSKEDISFIGNLNISTVELLNVKELLQKNQATMIESKGIKAYFNLDDSGIFSCTGVEFVYQKEKIETDYEGTLAKLGNTISKLFTKENKKNDHDNETANNIDSTNNSNLNNSESNEQANEESKAAKSDNKNETVKIVTVKEPVDYTVSLEFLPPLSKKSFENSLNKLIEITNAEEKRKQLESTFNALETHVIEMQQKLDENEYSRCATEKEKQQILKECSEISEWLYEDRENPSPEIYENRLKELKKLSNVIMARHWEHQERPDALKALDSMIDSAKKFLETAKNLTKDNNPEKDIFTQVEIDMLSKTIEETIEWKKAEVVAQNKLKPYEDVRLTVKDITDKMSALDRDVKYMVNKVKIWKPKTKPIKSNGATNTSENIESGAGKSDADSEVNDSKESVKDGESLDENITVESDNAPSHNEL